MDWFFSCPWSTKVKVFKNKQTLTVPTVFLPISSSYDRASTECRNNKNLLKFFCGLTFLWTCNFDEKISTEPVFVMYAVKVMTTLKVQTVCLPISSSYLSTVTIGPPPSAWCSSSETLMRSNTVERGEHCWGQLGQRKIQTSRVPMEVECETLKQSRERSLSIYYYHTRQGSRRARTILKVNKSQSIFFRVFNFSTYQQTFVQFLP